MPKEHSPQANMAEMKQEFLKEAGELWDVQVEGFTAILQEAEVKKVKLSFGVTLDFSESCAALETTISYSQVVKDKRSATFDDPQQPALPFGQGSDSGEPLEDDGGPVEAHKRRRKKGDQEAGD